MEVSSHALSLRRADGIHFAASLHQLDARSPRLSRGHGGLLSLKRRLFELLPSDAPAVVNLDDPRGSAMAEAATRTVTYAVNRAADVTPGPLSFSLGGLQFEVRTRKVR